MALRKATRMTTGAPPKVATPARRPVGGGATSGGLSLPLEPKEATFDLLSMVGFIYGPPKIGKTLWLSSFPDALFMMTDPGARGVEVYMFNEEGGGVTSWDIFLSGIDLLEKTPSRFPVVVVDTVDQLYNRCKDYCLVKQNLKSMPDDYGRTWDMIAREFSTALYRIINTGRGLWMTSHVKPEPIATRQGATYHVLSPTVSNQCSGIVLPLANAILYADYARKKDGSTFRVLILEGNDHVKAGFQAQPKGIVVPPFIELTKEDGYELFMGTLTGEIAALSPDEVFPSVTSPKAVQQLVTRLQRES